MKMFSEAQVNQVFFNYRGDELRYSFVSHLSDAFERHGIKFFLDKDEQRGKDLVNLYVRIQESKIALAIFSSRYAESSWCMDELVKMKRRADKGKLQVIPIFYKVSARDVRGQTGEFGDKFWALAKVSRGEQIMKWKDALECISGKMGLSLREKCSEADFIKEIIKEVKKVVAAIESEEREDEYVSLFRNRRRKVLNLFTSGAKLRSFDVNLCGDKFSTLFDLSPAGLLKSQPLSSLRVKRKVWKRNCIPKNKKPRQL